MVISIVAAYSSGETALPALSTATVTSARPVGSRNCTTPVPKSASGWGWVTQSAGALIENRPCGSRQATSVGALLAWAVGVVWGVTAAGFKAAAAGAALAGGALARGPRRPPRRRPPPPPPL